MLPDDENYVTSLRWQCQRCLTTHYTNGYRPSTCCCCLCATQLLPVSDFEDARVFGQLTLTLEQD